MKKIIILFLSLTTVSFSCEENKFETTQVEFVFRLLNEQGLQSTSFFEEENFILSFLIINKSSESFYLQQFRDDIEDFFRVYKFDTSEGGELIDLGKPYQSMFCLKIGGIKIEAGDTLKFETPWTVPDNYWPVDGLIFCGGNNAAPLKKGKYQVNFSHSFEFFKGDESFETNQLNFNIEFEMN